MTVVIPTLPGFDLNGRRALVVGASRGIGMASAAALAQSGAQVVAAARSYDELSRVCAALRDDGRRAVAVEADATDPHAIDALFSAHGPFDVVVNSVGTNRLAPLAEVEDEDLDALIDINIKTAFYINRAAVRSMRSEHIAGSIVTISSQMGLVGAGERTVYAATKHALEGMTKALAWEVGRDGIRVNTVSPTFIDTELARPILAREGFRAWAEARIALGRIGRLDEVMGPIVFLASNASSLVTGTALVVDGGWTAA